MLLLVVHGAVRSIEQICTIAGHRSSWGLLVLGPRAMDSYLMKTTFWTGFEHMHSIVIHDASKGGGGGVQGRKQMIWILRSGLELTSGHTDLNGTQRQNYNSLWIAQSGEYTAAIA
jgi:hypothetical protein